ncbi:hypothetical protein BCV73_08685 [Paenibacillus sp. SSG-1]|uniref:DUF7667 family protein n=1 Tax=Paenibacillus sp. SSG-1 TaxID=1443669 RepID=UPI000B8020DE|nr:hypothetical protein [Paenibacillus sp. SSG-1]OXL83144.1 hypothetical protein BCV73_08685 [Paenibacillus sp. SSG-1]
MKAREFAIHPSHRKLAEITFLNLDKNGKLKIDETFMRVVVPYLMQNYMIIRRLDELKHLSQVVYEQGDMDWCFNICEAIEALEDDLFIDKGEWK